MDKVSFLLFFITLVHFSYAQIEEGLLLKINDGSTTEINNLDTNLIEEGTLIYDGDQKSLKGYIDGQWKTILVNPLLAVVSEKTSNYTLTSDDSGTILVFKSNVDLTLTVPSGLPVGFNVSIYQTGVGKVNFVASGGATLKNRLSRFTTAGVDAGVGIISSKTDEFHLTGDLKK